MRKKYHDDPEYKEKVKEASKKSAEKRKNKRREINRTQRIAERNRKKAEYEEELGSGRGKRGVMNERVKREDGDMKILQPAGKLAIESGLSVLTIRNWCEDSILPFEPRVDENDNRWFTIEEVNFLSKMVLLHRDYCTTLDEFSDLLEEEWESF